MSVLTTGVLPVRFLTKEDSTTIPRARATLDKEGLKPITGYLCSLCYGQMPKGIFAMSDSEQKRVMACVRCGGGGFVWRRGHKDPNGENVYGDDNGSIANTG